VLLDRADRSRSDVARMLQTLTASDGALVIVSIER